MGELVIIISTSKDGPVVLGQGGSEAEVIANRDRLLAPRGITTNFIQMRPEHDDRIVTITNQNRDRFEGRLGERRVQCDGLLTQEQNLALEADPADCYIIVFFHESSSTLGLFHCGRNGSVEHLIEKGVREGALLAGLDTREFAKELMVHFSPGICKEHYVLEYLEVPREFEGLWENHLQGDVRRKRFKKSVRFENEDGMNVDLFSYNKMLLKLSGVPEDNIIPPSICTYESGKFDSHVKAVETGRAHQSFMVVAFIK
ncbi:MAG: polyphenol oxidase family protein [Candidatus Woesearchaeota archaeon]